MAKKKRRQSITNKIMTQVVEVQNEKTPHDLSRKNYIRNTKRFVKFCREKYDCKDFESCKEHIQDYCNYLQEQGHTASTVHTYIASVASTFDISMAEIDKPIRHIGDYTRGRKNILNRTNQDLSDIEFERIVEFQKIVGVRRNELACLTGDCLVYDESNKPCILIKKGKGNKEQYQRLTRPEDLEIIKPYFEGKAPNELIFTDKEINNDLNFHKLRALSAQEYYDIILNCIMTDENFKNELIDEIERRWKRCNINKETGKPKHFDRTKLEGWYYTRGTVREAAKKNGRPLRYNRLAVMAVSLFKTSHFRTNTTVQHYLILSV